MLRGVDSKADIAASVTALVDSVTAVLSNVRGEGWVLPGTNAQDYIKLRRS